MPIDACVWCTPSIANVWQTGRAAERRMADESFGFPSHGLMYSARRLFIPEAMRRGLRNVALLDRPVNLVHYGHACDCQLRFWDTLD